MMAGMIPLILTGLLRGVRTQHSLVLENLALRHQLVVLQRTVPRPAEATRRPPFRGPSVPPVGRLDGCRLGRPTRDADPVAAERLQAGLDLEEPPARTGPPGRRPGGPRAGPTDVPGQRPLGCAADSRGTAEVGPRDLAGDGVQVHGAPPEAPLADLAHLPDQSRPDPRFRRLRHRAHVEVQG